jgi:DNA-directed RNA polymerase subunit RPC12/RpoP
MGSVIQLQPKEEKEPKEETGLAGKARCLDCHHEWDAWAPIGTTWLECPDCSLMKGRFIFPVERKNDSWECNCGNDLFRATRQGFYCPNCGEWQHGF